MFFNIDEDRKIFKCALIGLWYWCCMRIVSMLFLIFYDAFLDLKEKSEPLKVKASLLFPKPKLRISFRFLIRDPKHIQNFLKKITPVPKLTTAYSKQASYDSLAQNI